MTKTSLIILFLLIPFVLLKLLWKILILVCFKIILCTLNPPLSKQGRHTGGILYMIRNSLVSLVRKLNSNYDLLMFVLLDKSLFGISKDVLYVCAYAMPQGSPYYNVSDVESGTELLEGCLIYY